jgi:geranylgeranyl reductase family protein
MRSAMPVLKGSSMYDVAIVGGGPAGSACAAFCAKRGLRSLLLERERFPREKVCGDCLNPSCWPVLARLGVADSVRNLPHGKLACVEFIGIGGETVTVVLPSGDNAEIAVKRSLFDHTLVKSARELGAMVEEGVTLTALSQPDAATESWKLIAGEKEFESRVVVAADGRNSTVARLCNLLPRIAKERIALQTHIPLPDKFGDRVVLQFRPEGYSGQAPVGEDQLNLCLVSTAGGLPEIRRWAEDFFNISTAHSWRTITPLARAPIGPGQGLLFLVGDAARVVEPFTGEGISYALRSGELAANAIARIVRGANTAEVARRYSTAHAKLYRGRLWINRLARAAVLHPSVASSLLNAAQFQPQILRAITTRIVRLSS